MQAATLTPPAAPAAGPSLASGIAVGLLAASIGALYTVYARWGIARGLQAHDLTALRFGIAGVLMLPVLWLSWRRRAELAGAWRLWLAVAALAGTPFGLLMFGALQFAPASHAAVFPLAAMSVAGLLLSALVLGDPITRRKRAGLAAVLAGLVLLSGLEAASLSPRAALGDAMFILAGTLWAGFGILLRKHRLDPGLATAVFPALAPGLAALMAWPVLGHQPGVAEVGGLALVISGLLIAVTMGAGRPRPGTR